MGKVVFVAGDGLVEWLAIGKAAEVEGASPAVFVEVSSEVVVAGLLSEEAHLPLEGGYLLSGEGGVF
jgi:hypothetical protein